MSTPSPFQISQPVRIKWFPGRQKGRFTFHRKSLMMPNRCLVWDHWQDTYKEVAIKRLRPDRSV